MAASSLALFGVAACGGDEDSDSDSTATATATAEETEDPAEEEVAPAGDGDTPDWANPVNVEGELMTSFEVGDLTVDAYEVAVDEATRSSVWADPDTDEPIVQEGDDVVIVNYVITNNGDPINLNYSAIEPSLMYDDWEYMQAPTVADNDLAEQYDVFIGSIAPGNTDMDAFRFGTGEQIATAEVTLYQPGNPFTISVDFPTVDESGERTGDTLEGEATGEFD